MSRVPGDALSSQQMAVLKLVTFGVSREDIATELLLSVNTVKVHLAKIYSVLGTSDRGLITRLAIEMNLVGLSDGSIFPQTLRRDGHTMACASATKTCPCRQGDRKMILSDKSSG